MLLGPRKRRSIAVAPRTAVIVPPSLMPKEVASGMSRMMSVRLSMPDSSISSRVMKRTGEGPSMSVRLMSEPVTSNFSSVAGAVEVEAESVLGADCAASDPVQRQASAPNRATATKAADRGLFIVGGGGG